MKHKYLTLAAAALLCVAGCTSESEEKCSQGVSKDFLQLATERYSVRKFDSKPVDQETIDKILKAGQIAPTAVNAQPQMIYVVRSDEAMEKMNRLSTCIFGAPQCFIFCYDDKKAAKRGENGSWGEIDVSIVLTHMMLEAANLGIGSCPVGRFDSIALKEEFQLPENIHPFLIMPFGYAAEDAEPSKRHSEYRSLDEMVDYL